MFVDLPLEQLRAYVPDVAEPTDFDAFWTDQVTAARAVDTAAVFEPVPSPLTHADVFDVTFPGYGGDPIKGWLLVPHRGAADAAVIVEFIGYNGGRGDPLDWLTWSAAGHPHFIMDSRGQGGGWRSADTADGHDSGEPSTNGFLTRGINDPGKHYYTRLYIDAVRAVDAVLAHPVAAGRRIVTSGGSQGGALTLVAAHLHAAVTAAMPDVPFLAHPRRAVEITDSKPFGEIVAYLAVHPQRVEQVFTTLSYVDVVNHAKRADVPALFSVGLLDDVTPASTVFAAYNHYRGPKQIEVYPFNDHDGGGTTHLHRKLRFARF
jgi:cephalosporin-C deacetylase